MILMMLVLKILIYDADADYNHISILEETVPADADDVSADYPHMILMLTIII